MHFPSDESGVKEKSMKPAQDVESSSGLKADNFLGVDSLSSPGSHDSFSHSESSTCRASNAPEHIKNIIKTVSKDSSPKSAVCSNKSDLTEISSLGYYASAKNEEQAESSLQGAQMTGLIVVQPDDDENTGDVAENHLNQKKCSIQSTIVLGEQDKPGVSVQALVMEDDGGSHDFEVEVTICDICGDLGREKLLAICSKCGEGAEHIYCMRVKLEEVPENWACEDCIIVEKDGKQKEEKIERGESLSVSRQELQRENSGSIDPECGLDFKDEEPGLIRNQKHKAGSCFAAERSENDSKTPANERTNSRKRKLALSQDCSVNKSVNQKMTEPGVVSPGVSLPEPQRPAGDSSTSGCANAQLSSTFDKSSMNDSIIASKKPCNNGRNFPSDDDPSNGRPHLGDSRVDPSWFHTFPLPYCVWRGRFKLQRNRMFSGSFGGIQAHLSRSSSDKYLTLAPGFSRDILLEEASRSTIWATQISGKRASAENIHIYFFTKDSESYQNDYRSLLEHMTMSDVCLKGNIGGFELFIFSSNTLEDGFQRWNGLYFLWGVFKDPTPDSLASSKSYSLCHQEHTGDLSRARTLQIPSKSLLFEHLQMRGRTFPEQTQENTVRHSESAAPNPELSLGLGGEASSGNVHCSKMQVASSSTNIKGDESLFSLSLCLPQPCLGEDVDTRLSLRCDFGRI